MTAQAESADGRSKRLRYLALGALKAERTELAARYFQLAADEAQQTDQPGRLLRVLAVRCAENGLVQTARSIAERLPDAGLRTEALLDVVEALPKETAPAVIDEILGEVAEASRLPTEIRERIGVMCRTAGLATRRGRREEAAELFEETWRDAGSLKDGSDAEEVYAALAVVAARLGRVDQALEAAREVSGRTERAKALLQCVRASLESAAGKGAPEYWADARSAGRRMDKGNWIDVLGRMASESEGLSDEPVVKDILAEAAEAARERAKATGQPSLLQWVAGIYGEVGDWETAARLAAAADDPYNQCKYQVRAILRAADEKGSDRLREQLRELPAEYLKYVGRGTMRDLAEAYYRARPEAGISEISGVEPQELRDVLYVTFAKKAAEQGNYPRATEFAETVAFPPLREEGLEECALAALENAGERDRNAAVAFMSSNLEQVSTNMSKLHLLFRLGMTLASQGDEDGATEMADRLRKLGREWHWTEGEAMSLIDRAIILSALGRPEDALKSVKDGMAAFQEISCSSCRAKVLEQVFGDFESHYTMEMVRGVLDKVELPYYAATYSLDALRRLPDLTESEKHYLLQKALESVLRYNVAEVRIEGLTEVAAAYEHEGLRPRGTALALLEAPPEPYVRPARPLPPDQPPAATPTDPDAVNLAFYTKAGCDDCVEVKAMLEELQQEDADLSVVTYDVSSEEGSLTNKAISEALGLPEAMHLVSPAVFSAERGLVGREITLETLRELVADAKGLPDPVRAYASETGSARTHLERDYKSLGLLVVVSAGLADGVNPCAFTVIIFFLSYMAYIGKDRREIAWAGGIFSLAVFLTYFAAGLGLARLVQAGEQVSSIFARTLYGVTALLVLVAAVLSFRDGLRARAGEMEGMALALPDKLKGKIRRLISSRARLGLTLGTTAVLGAGVALLELPCTGQMYLPVILWGLHHMSNPTWGPVGWLLLYNLCFIAPLLIVFGAVFFGLTSERLTSFFRRHLAMAKFAMAGMFSLLFVLLIVQIF
ncbi:MAG: hypothetical protein R6X33_00570 [Candidatus Brocadiia bacterium]